MAWRVYRSTFGRADGAIAAYRPVIHQPFTLQRGPANVEFTPTFIESLPPKQGSQSQRLRVYSAEITVHLEELPEVDTDA